MHICKALGNGDNKSIKICKTYLPLIEPVMVRLKIFTVADALSMIKNNYQLVFFFILLERKKQSLCYHTH